MTLVGEATSAPPGTGLPRGALPPSPAATRLDKPKWRDGRLLAGVLLLLASVVVGARLLSTRSDTTPTVVATSDLTTGHVLTAGDLGVAGVHLAAGQRGSYLGSASLPAVVGKALTRPVGRGELVPANAVAGDTASGTAEVSLSVRDGRHPALAAGDRVDVYATAETTARSTTEPGAGASASPAAGASAGSAAGAVCTTVPVAAGLEVVSDVPADGDSGAATVVLRVPPALAGVVVHAGEAATIDLVRAPRTGAGAAAGTGAAADAAGTLQSLNGVATGACATGK